jgi:tetratricopeptide (TPR) repeat protein
MRENGFPMMIGSQLKRWRLQLGSVLILSCVLPLAVWAQGANQDAEEQLAEAGQQALASGQYAVARTNFEKLAKLQPGIAEVHATLGVIDFKLRDYDQAVSEIRTAKKLKPSLPKLDSLLGMSLAELGQYKEALPGLEEGFKKPPDPYTKRMCGLQLMRAYTGLRRDSDAVNVALELNRLYPDDPEILYHTGRVYGNFAFLTIHKLEVVAPTSVWRHQAAAEAFESEGSTDSAIREYNEVLKLDPNRPKIHYRMGRTLLARWQLTRNPEAQAQAVKEFEQELQLDPGNANAMYELAEIHRQLNELDQARQLFESAIKYYPDFQQAHVGLAAILMTQQKPDLALPHLQRAVELNADDEVAWYRLVLADRQLGRVEEQNKALAQVQRLRNQIGLQEGTSTPEEVTKQTLQPNEIQ